MSERHLLFSVGWHVDWPALLVVMASITGCVHETPDLDAAAALKSAIVDAKAGEWVYQPVPGSVCMDGSEAGIAIRKADSGNTSKLHLHWVHGGTCVGDIPCSLFQALGYDHFTESDFFGDGKSSGLVRHLNQGVFSRSNANPLHPGQYTHVLFPNCEGDLHLGDEKDQTVAFLDGQKTVQFRGRHNLRLFIEAVKAHLNELPQEVVFSGDSAGSLGLAGGGYALAEPSFRSAKHTVLFFSGHFLPPPGISLAFLDKLNARWRLEPEAREHCPTCFSEHPQSSNVGAMGFYTRLFAEYPDTHFGMVSAAEDGVMSFFLNLGNLDPEAQPGWSLKNSWYEKALDRIRGTHLDAPNFHSYFVRDALWRRTHILNIPKQLLGDASSCGGTERMHNFLQTLRKRGRRAFAASVASSLALSLRSSPLLVNVSARAVEAVGTNNRRGLPTLLEWIDGITSRTGLETRHVDL